MSPLVSLTPAAGADEVRLAMEAVARPLDEAGSVAVVIANLSDVEFVLDRREAPPPASRPRRGCCCRPAACSAAARGTPRGRRPHAAGSTGSAPSPTTASCASS